MPPPTPNSPLNTPVAVPRATSLSRTRRGHAGHTRGVSTPASLAELSPRCAPIPSAPRSCSTSTVRSRRSPSRRRRGGARVHARAAERGRPALRPGRLRQRPARDRGPAHRLDRAADLHRQPRDRAAAARRERPGAERRHAGLGAAGPGVRAPGRTPAELCAPADPPRGQGGDRRASTGAAPRTRRRPHAAVRRDRRPRGGGGVRDPLGAQGARGPAAGHLRQGRRHRDAPARQRGRPTALYAGDDATDLDAFAALARMVERRQPHHRRPGRRPRRRRARRPSSTRPISSSTARWASTACWTRSPTRGTDAACASPTSSGSRS